MLLTNSLRHTPCRLAFWQVPRLVSLLAESFNAHMRFGSCLAIGISCAGTGSREAMDVLEPMMEDMVDFVRQVCTCIAITRVRYSSDMCLCSEGCCAA